MIFALPKPRREDRERRPVDTSELALPKAAPLRDSDYRAWVRARRRCLLHNFEGTCRAIGDRVPIEAAHLDRCGTGIKGTDASCVPLCPRHHDALDAQGLAWQIVAFLWQQALYLREEWHKMQ